MGTRVSSLPSSRRIWDGKEGGRTKLRSASQRTGSSALSQPCPHLDYAHPQVQPQAQGRPQVRPAVPTPLARACPQPQEGSSSDGSLRRGQAEGPLTGVGNGAGGRLCAQLCLAVPTAQSPEGGQAPNSAQQAGAVGETSGHTHGTLPPPCLILRAHTSAASQPLSSSLFSRQQQDADPTPSPCLELPPGQPVGGPCGSSFLLPAPPCAEAPQAEEGAGTHEARRSLSVILEKTD